MTNDEFSSYFNSYARRSPLWEERVKEKGSNIPGLDAQYEKEHPELERVNEANFPKIYTALKDESIFRGVEMPACYVSQSRRMVLGSASAGYYTIFIGSRADKVFTDREMRALVAHELKHLYQGKKTTRDEHLQAEHDCDRAAVSSTDYDTVKSYVHKAVSLMIREKIPLREVRSFMQTAHYAFPNILAEYCYIPSLRHPSPASRMKAMRLYADEISGKSPDLPWSYP